MTQSPPILTRLLAAACATGAAIPATPALAAAGEAAPLSGYADLRYRLEIVDQHDIARTAVASTLRVRAGVKSAEWHGFSGLVEGEAIMTLGSHRYNDTANGQTQYPVIGDPPGALLNQALVRWRPVEEVDAVAGRQTINLDNQRWIGSVNWRQNDQTFDAARLSVKPLPGLAVEYFHAWRVNRVFGTDSPQGIWRDTAINAARGAYTLKGLGTVSVYGYWLDIPASPVNSSRTIGVRVAGEQALGKGNALLYAVEYANQQDLGANPRDFSLGYLLLEPGIRSGPFTFRLGFERLAGNGSAAVQTPLATLHAFNGWADKFLSTPANGLRDIYADASYKVGGTGPLKGVLLRTVWHDYRSTHGGIDYGREWNALVSYPVARNVSLSAKVARYEAARYGADTTKGWLMAEAQF